MNTDAIRYFRQGGLLAVAFLLCVAVGLAYYVGSGRFQIALGIVVVFSGFMLGVLFGKNYYHLLVLGFTLNLPTLGLAGGRALEIPEAAAMGVGILALLRTAMKHERIRIFQPASVGVILYVAWVVFILWQNPIGFSILGGQAGGGRFYLKILLAAIAFFVLASQDITEKDAKRLFLTIMIATWISAAYAIFNYFRGGSGGGDVVDTEGFYTWHQALAAPALTTMIGIFAYFKPSEMFLLKRWPLVLLVMFLFVIALYSGKRASVAVMLIVPVMAVILRREWKYLPLGAISASALVAIIVLGHGNWFEAPKSMQRALSWLPGDWDADAVAGTKGEFRAHLRDLAWIEIRKDPLYGRNGIRVVFRDVLNWHDAVTTDFARLVAEGHAASSNWHNTWLGIAADFGVPAAAVFALFALQWVWFSYKGVRLIPHVEESRFLSSLAYFSLFTAVVFILRSWTSGHSAGAPFGTWWLFGLIVGVVNSWLARQRSRSSGREPIKIARLHGFEPSANWRHASSPEAANPRASRRLST